MGWWVETASKAIPQTRGLESAIKGKLQKATISSTKTSQRQQEMKLNGTRWGIFSHSGPRPAGVGNQTQGIAYICMYLASSVDF